MKEARKAGSAIQADFGNLLPPKPVRGESHAAAEEGPWPRGQVEFFQYQQGVEGHAVRPL